MKTATGMHHLLRQYREKGQWESAFRLLEVESPGNAEGYFEAALCYIGRQRWSEAMACLNEVLQKLPTHAPSLSNLASCLIHSGEYERAGECLDKLLALRPDDPQGWHNRASLAVMREDWEAALVSYEKAVAGPCREDTLCEYAVFLARQQQTVKALALLEDPGFSKRLSRVRYYRLAAEIRALAWDLEGSIQASRELLKEDPRDTANLSALVFHLHYQDGVGREPLSGAVQSIAGLFAGEDLEGSRIRERAAVRRDHSAVIRVGICSPSFHRHPVGFMTLAALEKLDPRRFHIMAFSDGAQEDSLNRRFRELSQEWHSTAGWDDATWLAQVRARKPDVILEMGGHARGGRLACLAKRVAPLQIKWVGGQFNSTGLPTMDGFISDKVETPDGWEGDFSERVYRLDRSYCGYEPPEYLPVVSPLPWKENGYPTFGCFNNLLKVNPPLLDLWARLLKGVPEARLFIKTSRLDSPYVRQKLVDAMACRGVEEHRLILEGKSPHRDLLESYHRVDIALDSYPYSGGLTTLEALWMGVPVFTVPGPSFAGRHAASHLVHSGHGDWVYPAIEVLLQGVFSWVQQGPEHLEGVRRTLRQEMEASCLTDTEGLARCLEQIFSGQFPG